MNGSEMSNETPKGDLIVFLHGGAAGQSPWSETAAIWDDTIAMLTSGGYRCIALDRPGHGSNPAAGLRDFTFEEESAYVAGKIAQHGGSAHIVGRAEAGITALLLSRKSTQREYGIHVRSVAIVGGHGAEPTGDGLERLVVKHPPFPQWSVPAQRWALRRTTFSGEAFSDADDRDLAVASSNAAAEILSLPGAAATIASDLLSAKGEIFAYARDHGFDVPISLIWGMHDPLSEAARAVELMNVLSTTSAHLELNLVDRAGHFVHRERPGEFLRILGGFLQRSATE